MNGNLCSGYAVISSNLHNATAPSSHVNSCKNGDLSVLLCLVVSCCVQKEETVTPQTNTPYPPTTLIARNLKGVNESREECAKKRRLSYNNFPIGTHAWLVEISR